MTQAERLEEIEFMEKLKRFTDDELAFLMKAIKVVVAVPYEQAVQVNDLVFKNRLSIEEVAERFGVAL